MVWFKGDLRSSDTHVDQHINISYLVWSSDTHVDQNINISQTDLFMPRTDRYQKIQQE